MVMAVIQYAPEDCAWCKGSGKFGDYADMCMVCNGLGSVMVAQPARKCPHCQGSGTTISGEFVDRCKVCSGAGWAHVFKAAPGGR